VRKRLIENKIFYKGFGVRACVRAWLFFKESSQCLKEALFVSLQFTMCILGTVCYRILTLCEGFPVGGLPSGHLSSI